MYMFALHRLFFLRLEHVAVPRLFALGPERLGPTQFALHVCFEA
jgi:hypothetical protein